MCREQAASVCRRHTVALRGFTGCKGMKKMLTHEIFRPLV